MIISASRRTDIPACYSEWFIRRLEAGSFCVRNPINPRQVSRILVSPETVDCIVFWTKNPLPMMERLERLREYRYYFQFTLTGYGSEVEPGLPDKQSVLTPAFCRLSEQIGSERVIWRYDPIFFNERYTAEYHLRAFRRLAEALEGRTRRVVISFLDGYGKIKRRMEHLHPVLPKEEVLRQFAGELAREARRHGMEIVTCAEAIDLSEQGIGHGCCIDEALITRIAGHRPAGGKDRGQREGCGCAASVEVGAYDTCTNGCLYCYACGSAKRAAAMRRAYRADSELLCGELRPDDKITLRAVK